jgi:tetratricopeptide (TPR) repeat protein
MGRFAVGTLTLTETETGDVHAKIDTAEVEHRDALKARFCSRETACVVPASDAAEGESRRPERISTGDALARFGRLLDDSPYELEEIPNGDLEVSLSLDVSTGMVVGAAQTLNPARQTASVAQGISQRLAELPATLSRESLAAVSAASVDGNPKKVVDALRMIMVLLPADTRKLGDILAAVDPQNLDDDDRVVFLENLARGSEQNPARLERTVDLLLRDHSDRIGTEEVAKYKLARAVAISRQGNLETALQLWRDLAAHEGKDFPLVRAGALLSIAKALEGVDSESAQCARMAADAYLECGHREDAVRALVGCARCTLHGDVRKGIAVLHEAEALFELDGVRDRYGRASLLQLRAGMHFDMGDHRSALRDAVAAEELLDGILRAEPLRCSVLMLAIDAARKMRDTDIEVTLSKKLDVLRTAAPELAHFHEDAASLVENYDANVAARVVSGALTIGVQSAPALMRVLRASSDPLIPDGERLRECEAAAAELEASPRGDDHALGLMAVAEELIRLKDYSRAAHLYAKAVEYNPVLHSARQRYASLLLKTNAWKDLAGFAEAEIRRFGNAPGRLLLRGRALLELGDANGALRALQLATTLVTIGTSLANEVHRWREAALSRGATAIIPESVMLPRRVVSSSDLRDRVTAFGQFISHEKRMQFWRVENRKHEWMPSPERIAKSELHTFLKASFNEGIETLEEVFAGAGRIDLYVLLSGGGRAVVELKMCGAGYSSSYAFEGIEQVTHYMENRRTSLGLLVIFDARARDFGIGLKSVEKNGNQTIYCYFVDVRPKVKGNTVAGRRGG